MASASVKSAASSIGTLLSDEATFLWKVRPKVERLQAELIMASSFLVDVESQDYHSSEVASTLVTKIRDLSYEAEDIIQKYSFDVSQQREDGIFKILKWLCCLLCNAKSLHDIGSDIDALMNKLNDLTKQLNRYRKSLTKAGQCSSSSASNSPLNRTFSFHEVNTVGLIKDTETLVNQLVNEKNCSVISINGMGGLGKSTLAKNVFQDPNVKNSFDKSAWVFVSQQFDENKLLRSILKRLYRGNINEADMIDKLEDDMLAGKLYEILQHCKCLVVLDDIWQARDWKRLEPAFRSIQNSQSKLLITTRNAMLLSNLRLPPFLHQPQFLNEDDSWELFQRHAFHGMKTLPSQLSEMERLGREMAKKCKGLPLAILALSGSLSGKKEVKLWKRVHQNMLEFMNNGNSQSEEDQLLFKVLELSYSDLPHHLRNCFLYMASFPEDFQIPFKRLWRLWEAERLLIKPHKDSEDVAADYLTQLIQRCLVQVGNRNNSGKIKTCQLHDMMRDMCIRKAEEENFFHVLEGVEGVTGDSQKTCSNSGIRGVTVHRLAVHHSHKSKSKFDDATMGDCTHIRSLIIFDSPQSDIIKAIGKLSPQLRLLDLEGVELDKFPEEIADIVHLRYLSLKATTLIEVPPLVGKLKFLETLDLRTDGYTLILPLELLKMTKLVHLYFPKYYNFGDEGNLKLSCIENLETVINIDPYMFQLEDFHKSNKLKRISFVYRMLYMDELYEEKSLDVPLAMASISSVKGLKKPFNVTFSSMMLESEPQKKSQIYDTQKIDLSRCQLTLMVNKLDHLVLFPSTVSVLQLMLCYIKEDPFPFLEKMPHLRCLSIQFCLWTKMVCTQGGFPMLNILILCNLPKLEEWEVEKGAMPNLTHLYAVDCDSFRRKEISNELVSVIRGKITCQAVESQQSGHSDMQQLYDLCTDFLEKEYTTEPSQYLSGNSEEREQRRIRAFSNVENMLNKILLLGNLSLEEGKRVLYCLFISFEVVDETRIKLKPKDDKYNYIGSYGLFKRWTWPNFVDRESFLI